MRGQERVGGSNNQEPLGSRFNPEFQTPFLGNRQPVNREFTNNQGRANRRNIDQDLEIASWENSRRNRPRFLNRDY